MTQPPDDRDPRSDDRPEYDRPDFDQPDFDEPDFDRPDLGREARPEYDRPDFRQGRLDDDFEPEARDEAYDDADLGADEPDDDYEDEFTGDASDEADEAYDEFEDEPYDVERAQAGPNPVRRDPPVFAPVVFDDEEDRRRSFLPGGRGERGGRGGGGSDAGRGGGTGRYQSDASLLRVLALIGVLGVVILALVLPFSPISVVGGGSDDSPSGISASVSDEMPPVPEGLEALSDLYVIEVEEGIAGPLSVEVQLTDGSEDSANMGYYAWDGNAWSRVGAVQLAAGGGAVTGSIPAESASIAVLRRTALAHSMGMMVGPGETPDPDGLSAASLVVVTAGALEDDGGLNVESAALRSAQQVAGDRPVYLGVSGDAAAAGIFESDAATTQHVDALVAAAEGQDAAGVYIEYVGVADGNGFTAFVASLADALRPSEREVIVGVPFHADEYDWAGIAGVAGGLWVQSPLNPVDYHATVGSVLAERGVSDASNVSVILDRRSAMAAGDGPAVPISLIEALTVASMVDFNVDAISAGSPVTLRTAYLGGGAERQLHWDDEARAVSFTFSADEGDSTIWFQNRYSFGFALQAAARGGFGGVAVRSAAAGGSHPAVWEQVAQFVEEGNVNLLRPYGPYLTPCWEAPDGSVEGQPECWTTETDTTAVVWRAPVEAGAYTVRLVVSEGTTFVGQEVVLRVGDEEETSEPTEEPTEEATEEPTEVPTEEPTEAPTEEPTEVPADPTEVPAEEATEEPTEELEAEPTEEVADDPAPTSTTEDPPGPGGNEVG